MCRHFLPRTILRKLRTARAFGRALPQVTHLFLALNSHRARAIGGSVAHPAAPVVMGIITVGRCSYQHEGVRQ